jgi:MinD-like ATPase involved in chromosome partitioning or flagellar assembly
MSDRPHSRRHDRPEAGTTASGSGPSSPGYRPPIPYPPGQPRHRVYPPAPPQPQADTDVLDLPGGLTKSPPGRGWRRLAYTATFGLVNLGPSAAERRVAQHESLIRSPLSGHVKVGVLGKGGVGKTSVAASVGSVFAELRPRDHVVAVDADTAFGRLSGRIDPAARGTYIDLAAERNPDSFDAVSSRMGSNRVGLYVLAGDAGVPVRRPLDPALYRETATRLERHFAISVIDCGSTMDAPVTREAMRDLDALIVVSSPWADGASTALQTIDWLAANGRAALLRRAVVVLNDSDGHADRTTRSSLAQHFAERGHPVVEVPFDPHLRTGGVIDVSGLMSRSTRDRFLEIAAAVAANFAAGPHRY